MNKILNYVVSSLFGKRWFLFFLIALFIFLAYGVWIFSIPEYEVMYNHHTLPVVQTEKVSVHCHILEIGNTGRKIQASVDVIFSTDAFSATAMTPTVRDFGVSDRKTGIKKSDDTTIIGLGKLESDKRVEIKLVYIYQKDEMPYDWDDIFIGIEAARGKVLVGDPGWTTVGRLLFAVFG